jgi:type IV pilus assembly protein PilA
MFCTLCGATNSNDKRTCVRCGASLQSDNALDTPSATGAVQTSGKAIASLICGLLFFIFPVAIVAVILGHLSLSDIRKSGGRLIGNGMAIAGLVLGYMGLAAIPFILIIAAIAIPNLLRSRMAANEASAVGSLRTISTGEVVYNSTYANGFSPSLQSLGGAGGLATCDHAELIDPILATGTKSGYAFSYTPTDPVATAVQGCASPGATGYSVTADPVNRGTTGQRGFYTDQSAVIRFDPDGTASPESAPLR